MTSISPKQKERLQRALDSITDECSNGLDPNDAIVKVAKNMNLQEDELPLLVRGYNVGATNAQWKSTKDQQIKLAEFPIADIDKINSILYPKNIKTASARRQKQDNTFEKSASSIFEGCFKKEYDMNALPLTKSASCFREEDVQNMFKKEDAILQQVKHIRDEVMLQKYAAKQEFDNKVREFAEVLEDPYAQSIAFLTKSASALYGTSGEKLIQYTLDRFPDLEKSPRLVKNASAVTSDSKFCRALNSALNALDKYIELEVEEKKAHVKCAEALEPIAKSRKEAIYGDEIDQMLLAPEEVYKKKLEKTALVDVIPSLDDYIARTDGPAWDMANGLERAALKELHDRSPLRNQKVRALLLDIMSSDPYLRQQDPDVITSAFNDLYEANPTDALKRIWLKSHLPQYIASESLDAPTLSSIIEGGRSAEKANRERIQSLFEQFMNDTSVRERLNRMEQEENRRNDEKERFEYQKFRDEKQDAADKKRFDYQKKQDKKRRDDEKKRFDYQKEQDSARKDFEREQFNYKKDQDYARNRLDARRYDLQEQRETNRDKHLMAREYLQDQKEKNREQELKNKELEAQNRKTEIDDAKAERAAAIRAKEQERIDRENAWNQKQLDIQRERAAKEDAWRAKQDIIRQQKDYDTRRQTIVDRINRISRAIGDSKNAKNNGDYLREDRERWNADPNNTPSMKLYDELRTKFGPNHEILLTPRLNERTNPQLMSALGDAWSELEDFDKTPRPQLPNN